MAIGPHDTTTYGKVQVPILNGALAYGNRPTSTYCPGERDDTRSNLSDGNVVWISGCVAGATNILVADSDYEVLTEYEIEVVRDIETSFDIELVFLGSSFTSTQKSFVRRAADRWEQIITEGIPDVAVDFDSDAMSWWSRWGIPYRIVAKETIDDVRVYVYKPPLSSSVWASGGVLWYSVSNTMPILGAIKLREDVFTEPEHIVVEMAMHEIAHALGFGTLWDERGLLGNPSDTDPDADTYFAGLLAIDAFNYAGGWGYTGRKVPVENGGNDGHWRESVFDAELMSPESEWNRSEVLSDITLQSMADIGYKVDLSHAEPYTLPPASKPAAPLDLGPRCDITHLPPPGVQH